MIKKMIVHLITIAIVAVCGISAYAYDNDTNVSICASRTGEDNTYIIQVSFNLNNHNNKDYKQISRELKGYDYFTEVVTPFDCELYINDEPYSLGKGYANRYFNENGNIYWEFVCELDGYGYHNIEADIYKHSQIIAGCMTEVESYPPHQYSSLDATEDVNISYAYNLLSLINDERVCNDYAEMDNDYELIDLAETRLIHCMQDNQFSHNNLNRYYNRWDIDFNDRDEVFIYGACDPYEAMQTLLQSEAGSDLVYGDYDNIGIAAICDRQNIMHWAIEVYE